MHEDLNEKILKIETANYDSEYNSEFADDMTADQIEDEYAELKKRYADFDDEYAADILEVGSANYDENEFAPPPPDGEIGQPDGTYNPKSMEAGTDNYLTELATEYPETDFTPYHSTAKYTMIPDPEEEDMVSTTQS